MQEDANIYTVSGGGGASIEICAALGVAFELTKDKLTASCRQSAAEVISILTSRERRNRHTQIRQGPIDGVIDKQVADILRSTHHAVDASIATDRKTVDLIAFAFSMGVTFHCCIDKVKR
jgi:copper homeostasis protein CutC